jgi:riboflavin synthase
MRPSTPHTGNKSDFVKHMFTGLIEEIGNVLALETNQRGTRLSLITPHLSEKIAIGDSVAVNGCCLTIAALQDDQIAFDLLGETIERTNLKTLRRDDRVNLERAVALGGQLGGHFVQGHIDCAARILALKQYDADWRLEIELPAEFAQYLAAQGSIAVNGISLTVAEVAQKSFAVWIIPHTKAQTNLATARPGDLVNLEFDLLAKYVERMLDRRDVRPT